MEDYLHLSEISTRRRYPAGESHVELSEQGVASGSVVVEAHCRNFEDLCELLTVQRIFERRRVSARWLLPYFPFARHDRRNHAWDGCELEVALDLLRSLDVTIIDPHSDVSARLRHIPQAEVVEHFQREKRVIAPGALTIIPDLGASKKAKTWNQGYSSIQAYKTRDPATGKLSGFGLAADQLDGQACTVVDDICDGGGTFIGLAQLLKAKGAGALSLVVSHGLFTRGTDELFEHYERIFCLGQCACPRVETLSFQSIYEQGKTQ